MERLAFTWLGPPQQAGERFEGSLELPPPLQRFYEVARRWPQLILQNELIDPPEREGERLLFYVENQGVCSWTTGIEEDDPPVWADHDGKKVKEEEPLSRFLVTVAILELVLHAPEGVSTAHLPRDRFSDGFGPLRRLPFAPWRGFPEETTCYASDELLAVSADNSTPEGKQYLSVWIGARDPPALASLDPLVEGWEHDSRRD